MQAGVTFGEELHLYRQHFPLPCARPKVPHDMQPTYYQQPMHPVPCKQDREAVQLRRGMWAVLLPPEAGEFALSTRPAHLTDSRSLTRLRTRRDQGKEGGGQPLHRNNASDRPALFVQAGSSGCRIALVV